MYGTTNCSSKDLQDQNKEIGLHDCPGLRAQHSRLHASAILLVQQNLLKGQESSAQR